MRIRLLFISALITLAIPASSAADTIHVVLPGETLTSIAATDGLTVSALAAANGLSVTSELIIGEEIEIPPLTPATSAVQSATVTTSASPTITATSTTSTTTSTTSTTTTSTPTTTPTIQPAQVVNTVKVAAKPTPHPTLQRVNAQEIALIADANSVPAPLVEAVAWQESGWNNDEVSATGAVGVMQLTPASWRWIDQYLTPGDPLKGRSATENVRAGTLLLHQLLVVTGSQKRAIEAYFQGLASLEEIGPTAATKHYVADVLAIEKQLEA